MYRGSWKSWGWLGWLRLAREGWMGMAGPSPKPNFAAPLTSTHVHERFGIAAKNQDFGKSKSQAATGAAPPTSEGGTFLHQSCSHDPCKLKLRRNIVVFVVVIVLVDAL